MSSYGTSLQDHILQIIHHDDKYTNLMLKLQQDTSDQDVDYHLTTDGLVRLRDKIYVSYDNKLKKLMFREFHVKPYLGHPGYQKMLTIVNKFYYWPNLKKEVAEFMATCLDFQQVKSQCKHPGGLLHPILIPEWKWEFISMEFITSFPRKSRQHASIMVLVDRL